jgi:hypothetical protein
MSLALCLIYIIMVKGCTVIWNLWASAIIVKCVWILAVVFISLWHQHLDHFHEEDEVYNHCSHEVHLCPQSTGTSSERMHIIRIPRVLWSWQNMKLAAVCIIVTTCSSIVFILYTPIVRLDYFFSVTPELIPVKYLFHFSKILLLWG